ncbi:MAG: hypothetical protein QNJ46_13105 [Leptolyngbyaceae cyanobacterium MO_188.B28]|nr:hypothetical protein [Leptolyngbyaceae cyanobacterium MO_188.B28]
MDESKEIKAIAYEQLCNSYRAIDDFRSKLLALLPLATGGGIFLLVGDGSRATTIEPLLPAIGIFGFIVTLGLFFFELHAIWKCTHLIKAGENLEKHLDIKLSEGQFRERPLGIFYFINEPFAASIVYPAVLAAWFFLAMDFEPQKNYSVYKLLLDAPYATRVFIVGFILGFFYDLYLVYSAYQARNAWRPKKRNRKPMQ